MMISIHCFVLDFVISYWDITIFWKHNSPAGETLHKDRTNHNSQNTNTIIESLIMNTSNRKTSHSGIEIIISQCTSIEVKTVSKITIWTTRPVIAVTPLKVKASVLIAIACCWKLQVWAICRGETINTSGSSPCGQFCFCRYVPTNGARVIDTTTPCPQSIVLV